MVYFPGGGQKQFSRGPTAVKFHFTNSKPGEKRFSGKKLIGKQQT